MKKEKSELKTKIIDWFIITRIRILNFIKEHKYLSVGIGTFIFSCIVLLVAFAQTDDYSNEITVSNSSVTSSNTQVTDAGEIAKSFSTIDYNVSYKLDVENKPQTSRTVIIEAELPEGVDASWDESNENNTYKLEGRKLRIETHNKKTSITNTEIIKLNINNVKAGTIVNPSFTIYESTANIEQPNKKAVVSAPSVSIINDKTVSLMTKAVSGIPYKVNSFEGRYIPYGIIVGIPKKDLNQGTMEGLYFEPSIDLNVSAMQEENGSWVDTQIINDKNLYGIYDKNSNKYFINTNLPHYMLDYNFLDERMVFNSGNINLEYGNAEQKEKEEVSIETISLVGKKDITIWKNASYENSIYARGILIGSSNEEVCATSDNNNCTIRVLNDNNEEVNIKDFTKNEGIYKVEYTYTSDNGSITTYRNITVTSSEEYELIDGDTIDIYTGEEFKDPGIIKEGTIITPISTEIRVKDKVLFNDTWKRVTSINTSEENEYQIIYTISTEDENKNLTRTVNIKNINNLEKTTSSSVLINNMQIPVNASSYTPSITVGKTKLECNSTNGCSYEFDKPLDTKESGTYKITYTINKDDFVVTLSGYVYVALGNTMVKISDIKSNGKIYYSDDQMVGLGTYYLTVSSPRKNGYKKDIPVQFNINDKTEALATNLYFDPGILNLTTSLNEYNYGSISELSEKDYLVYGDDNVILRYLMEYAYGDTNKNLSVIIPIQDIVKDNSLSGVPFEIMKYYPAEENEAEDFYLSGIDISKTSVKYILCKKGSNNTCEDENDMEKTTMEEVIEAYEQGYILKSIICDFGDNIKPGTTIDFRIRLKVSAANSGKAVNVKAITKFKNIGDNSYQTKEGLTKSVNITAFQARSKVLIGETEETLKEQDKTIDGATVSYSTIAIYPSVSMPAANITTNVIGTTQIDKINVSIELPAGVNFVYNDNYLRPSTISGNKVSYVIRGQQLNEWVEPIYLNVSYNIDIPVGTLEFKVVTQAIIGDITDSSSESLRTTIRKVMYQNSAKVAVGQYTNNLSISKGDEFNVITKVYNNTSEIVNDMSLVTILPANDVENSKYSGIYTLEDVPDGAMCSTNEYALVSNPTNYSGEGTVTFRDCETYKADEYLGVTAIKTNITSLASSKVANQTFKIKPQQNNTGDIYKVKALLISNEVVEANTLSIEVISKKITGTIWEDFDHNGLYDSSEKPIEGVTLTLVDSTTDEEIDQTTSNENGAYSFVDLKEGTYHIIAQYNTAKYGLSQIRLDIYDKSKISSFTGAEIELPTDCEIDQIDCENCKGEECDICELDCFECEDEYCEQMCEELENNTCEETIEKEKVAKTKDAIVINANTKVINNINLGLTLNMEYSVKLTKYVTKAITTNAVGFATTNDFGKSKLAKLDVKDINKTNIKVIYTIELENIGYYPGYIYRVKDYIPDGMTFNPQYEENQGWELKEDGYIENNSLEKELVYAGDKKYLTVAFDITRKEAGSFINYALVEDEDLHILAIQQEGGNKNEK